MSRRFNLEDAEGLLPEIEARMREAISLKSELELGEGALQSIKQRVIMLGGLLVDRAEVNQHLYLATSRDSGGPSH